LRKVPFFGLSHSPTLTTSMTHREPLWAQHLFQGCTEWNLWSSEDRRGFK
jgi:hypothetical protein